MLNLTGRLLLIHGNIMTTVIQVIREAPLCLKCKCFRYEEISSFPPNGVERFQFSTRTGHYSQVNFSDHTNISNG